MNNDIINNVSDTALWIAAFRAQESENADAIFKDTLAKKLAGERGYHFMEATPHKHAMSFAMVIRTSAIDRLVEMAVNKGIDTVINLGAGLDTRPYRMKLSGHLRWIEIDLPGIITYKEQQLMNESPVCDLHRIAFDLSDDAARDKLFNKLGADTKNALVITEGLIGYLTNDQAARLSRSIYQIPAFRLWVMDYSQGKYRRHRRAKDLRKMVVNTPIKFDESNPIQFFERDGWKIDEDIHILDEARRVGREFPAMFPWNLLIRLSRSMRETANNTYGYVMFGK